MTSVLNTVTCPLTGIVFAVELETAIGNLPCYHPFSIANSIVEITNQSARKGIKIEDIYTSNTLAGMLITVLQDHGLIVCKHPEAANQYLSHCKPITLSNAIRYILNKTSFYGLPRLSLVDFRLGHHCMTGQHEAEELVNNYIRACQGHVVSNSKIILPPPPDKKSIKVYTDKVRQEGSNIRNAKERARVLMGILHKRYDHKLAKMLADIDRIIRDLEIIRKEKRIESADMLEMVLDSDKEGAELAEILRTSNTEAIQQDLDSVESEIDSKTVTKSTTGKITVDFMSMLARK